MIKKNYFYYLIFTYISLFFLGNAFADGCLKCANRKKDLCLKECSLTNPKFIRTCQKDCIKEYCSHRCGANEDDSKVLERLFSKNCEECKAEQFNLCKSNCTGSSELDVEKCSRSCAKRNCSDVCLKKSK